jgi:hypothetical protein
MEQYPLQFYITIGGKEIPFKDMPEEYRDRMFDGVGELEVLLSKITCLDHGGSSNMIWVSDVDGKKSFRIVCCCWVLTTLMNALAQQSDLPLIVSTLAGEEAIPAIQLQRQGELATHLVRCLLGEDAADPSESNPNNIWPHPN